MKKLIAWLVVVMVVMPGLLWAGSFRPLPTQSKVELGATHVATFKYSDLTTETTNTAQTITNVVSIAANTGVELVAMKLITAFDTGNTNYTGSLAVEVYDAATSATATYLSSTELASDGTEVFIKYGEPITNAVPNRAVYTSAGNIAFVFTPNDEEAVDDNTSGEVEFYFRLTR